MDGQHPPLNSGEADVDVASSSMSGSRGVRRSRPTMNGKDDGGSGSVGHSYQQQQHQHQATGVATTSASGGMTTTTTATAPASAAASAPIMMGYSSTAAMPQHPTYHQHPHSIGGYPHPHTSHSQLPPHHLQYNNHQQYYDRHQISQPHNPYQYAHNNTNANSSIPSQKTYTSSSSFSRQRSAKERPIVKLTTSLIDTYKNINRVYYEERTSSSQNSETQESSNAGARNHGWDDEHYDYIITEGDVFLDRYEIRSRIGKGSFGQVVRAFDREAQRDVAIKIIKSKKPFLMQAKTEIELLSRICTTDRRDEHNIVRLQSHFMHRNHQCLVFEMLSLNLYELLKNTQFGGVSLKLIRKFTRQILRALSYLARPEIDIIHCDLKPENILLCHPKRSGVKVIDFGSSCKSNKRMYSYIQSRFYRSPEVMLGLPYSVSIDMWSLGCILVEMHTGEPLFSGSDQVDQMQKIVKVLGMPPHDMIEKSGDQNRTLFFEKDEDGSWRTKNENKSSLSSRSVCENLTEVIMTETAKKKKAPNEPDHTPEMFRFFVDLLEKMFKYDPLQRIKPDDALNHPFVASIVKDQVSSSNKSKSTVSETDETSPNFKGGNNDSSSNLSFGSEQESISRNKSLDVGDISFGVSTRSTSRRGASNRSTSSQQNRGRRVTKSSKQSEKG